MESNKFGNTDYFTNFDIVPIFVRFCIPEPKIPIYFLCALLMRTWFKMELLCPGRKTFRSTHTCISFLQPCGSCCLPYVVTALSKFYLKQVVAPWDCFKLKK